MKCPNGHEAKQLVVESRQAEDYILRKRYCCQCNVRYTTKEEITTDGIPKSVHKYKQNRPDHDRFYAKD